MPRLLRQRKAALREASGHVRFLLSLFQSQSCLAFWNAAVIPEETTAENCEDFLPRCTHSMFCFVFLSFWLKIRRLTRKTTTTTTTTTKNNPKVLVLISEDRPFLTSKQNGGHRDEGALYNRGHNALLAALYQSGLSGYGDKQPSDSF